MHDARPGKRLRGGAILEYAARLTKEPWTVIPAHIERLRDLNLSDRAILEAKLVAGYVSFVNRLALGLGIQLGRLFRQFTR